MANDIRVWFYPGANPNLTPTDWESYATDISAYVRRPGRDGGAPILYQWGKQDESIQTDAGKMTLTLDNRDGRFSSEKIDGPHYGLLDTNTPIRMGVMAVNDTFTRTVASGWGTVDAALGQAWTVFGSATFSTNGSRGEVTTSAGGQAAVGIVDNGNARDADLRSIITPLVTATGASYGMGHIVRYSDSSNYVYSTLEFNTAGDATIKVRRILAGSITTIASLNPIPSSSYTANVAWKLRTQADGDVIRVKAWPAASGEPLAWMLTATERDNSGTGNGVYIARFSGNTNSASAILAIDDFTVLGFEFTGFVVSWPLRWDMSANNSWAPITAAGAFRRLRQGTNPIQSPLRRQLGATADASGYWPMEEGSAAKYFLGATPGASIADFAGVTPAGDDTLPGGGPAPVINDAAGYINANVKINNNGSGMSGMVLFKIPSMPGSKTRIARIRTSRGPASIWDFSITATDTVVEAYDSQFNLLSSATNTVATTIDGVWVAWQLETDNTSGNTAWSAIYHVVGEVNYYAQTGTVTGGTNSNISSMRLTGPVGTAFAHIWMGRNTLPFNTDTFSLVSSGYAGETAAARFARVWTEAGVSYSIAGTDALVPLTEPMGPQKEATAMAVSDACAQADFGVVVERGAGLEMIPRNFRWNLTQTVALSVASGHIGKVPEPIRDDQALRNKWTMSRTNGGSSSFEDAASILRNGTWEDFGTINVQDDSVLVNHAAWRVKIGTGTRLRWPIVPLNFARSPSLINAWRKRFYGWRIGITTGLTQVKGNEPDLVMEGFQASLDPEVWTVDMNCTDARVWAAAVSDNTGIYGRIDMDTGKCTSTASINSTDTSIAITTATGYMKWDNTAGLWSGGVDFNVGGERVTVTSISNGAGQAQTLTVSARGVNGYAASHASGTVVSLWFPAPAAL